MTPIVFWQNIPSILQAPLIRAVARIWPGEVLIITESTISDHRLQQGWTLPDFSPARLVIAPTKRKRERLAREYGAAGAIHIFSGLHAYPETYNSLKQVSHYKATIGVFAEPAQSNDGIKAVLRRSRYYLEGLKWRQRLNFFLVTGELGKKYYRQCGFPEPILHIFGYFVECRTIEENRSNIVRLVNHKSQLVKFRFVGQLVPRKGLDLLLHALAREKNELWCLDVVGEGPKGDEYKALANRLGLAEKVRWLGIQPNGEVCAGMALADVLVLPSRYDGWGAVVNEALMAGTRVIVSDACGASELVRESWLGQVFSSGSVEALSAALRRNLGNEHLLPSERSAIRDWAISVIAPESAAQYLMEIIKHAHEGGPQPVAPWRQKRPDKEESTLFTMR